MKRGGTLWGASLTCLIGRVKWRGGRGDEDASLLHSSFACFPLFLISLLLKTVIDRYLAVET